jgi:hypothetical protein
VCPSPRYCHAMSTPDHFLTPPLLDELAVLRDPTLSSYREQLVEYLFLSELLQDAWLRRRQRLDVLRADVDGAGYDLVAECQGVVRHIQLKSTVAGGTTRSQKVHTALASHRSGCVVWVVLDQSVQHRLRMSFLALGALPGERLQGLDVFPVARHTKANAEGLKADRPAIREVPRTAFSTLSDVAAVSDWLFGAAG